MSDYTYASEVFFSELVRISTDIVWKNPTLAKANEDSSQSVYIDQYMLARQGKLTFDLIFSFDRDVLIASGLTEEQADDGSEVSYEIPEDKRDLCTANQIAFILNSYDEPNNYYRMLNGQPDIDDTDYVYNTKYPNISDNTTPIHLLPLDTLYILEDLGYLEELQLEYPSKKYLKHLTGKKIDPYTARNSDDYAILWMDYSEFSSLVDDFKDTYNACRRMITSIFNAQTIQNNNNEYTGFIGLVILFVTIIQMNKKFLDADITREFYDQDSLKYIYDSYGVPFYSSIPMEYHKLIVKNINRLISYKGSTQVIFELFDIFGLPDMSVYEFYMMKTHKFQNGKPIFVKKEDGSYDLEAMYDIKFAKVQLYNDPVTELSDPQNRLSYDDMVRNDPYWISDKELLDKIYREEYNYIESKYLGIQTTFDLMKILYEYCYYLKLIIDNRVLLSSTTLFNNNIKGNVNIFDLVIYICALMCKKYGYEGNIPSDPHEVGKVLGFNFRLDLETLQKSISETDYLKNDTELLNYLSTMNVYSLDSIRVVYTKLTELRSYLSRKMAETSIPEEYWAYYELYNSIMYSEYVDGVFKKTDGTTALSFADMLKDCNELLYNRLMDDESYDISDEISYNLYLLKSSCSALSQIQYMDNVNIDLIIEYLLKLIEFFKSAKADITDYSIVYSLAAALDNNIKLMNYIDHINESMSFEDYIDELYDLIFMCRDIVHFKDNIITWMDSSNLVFSRHFVDSQIERLDDYIKTISCLIKDVSDNLQFHDTMSDINIYLLDNDGFEMKDMVTLLYDDVQEIVKYFLSDEYNIYATLHRISEILVDNKNLSSTHEFESRIIYTLTSQKLIATYKNIDKIQKIQTYNEVKCSNTFTDNILETLTQYILSFSDQKYTDLINVNTDKHNPIISNGMINNDTINDILEYVLIQHGEVRYIHLVSDLVSIVFQHHIESILNTMSNIFGHDNSIGTSDLRNMDADVINRFDKLKQASTNTISDQLVLLHESIIED